MSKQKCTKSGRNEESAAKAISSTPAFPFTIVYASTGGKPKNAKPRRSISTFSASPSNVVAVAMASPAGLEPSPFDSQRLDVAFSVKPAEEWNRLKLYRSFTVPDVVASPTLASGVQISLHDYVFVNNSNLECGTELSMPPSEAYWVARVQEIRASDDRHIYVRVLWMYSPDDLPPGGHQDYHGDNELVASNHMDIIDAMTVSGKALVDHWLEKDDEENPPALFWRQTYNYLTRRLSTLRKRCVCLKPYKPENSLVRCNNPRCDIWLHSECLEDDAASRAYKGRIQSDNGNNNADNDITNTNNNDTAAQTFHAQLILEPDLPPRLVVVEIRHLSPPLSSSPSPSLSLPPQPMWTEDVECLQCGEKIV
ncbi:MAG: hypothetical protein M1826_002812 [Phylliscum demangeonii]|nr:MAG: hypothetical protein M1826_002812 [Phylliscum demangeonii]